MVFKNLKSGQKFIVPLQMGSPVEGSILCMKIKEPVILWGDKSDGVKDPPIITAVALSDGAPLQISRNTKVLLVNLDPS